MPDFPPLPGEAPAAFMGYKRAANGGFMVRVCSYHGAPEVRKAEKWAGELPVSHGICCQCYAREMGAMLGESAS